jgi:hypothetical protein
MTKPYKISIVVSGAQGEVMRSDHAMPLAMIDVIKKAIDKARCYEDVAAAVRVGPVSVEDVCRVTGLGRRDAKRLLQIAKAAA